MGIVWCAKCKQKEELLNMACATLMSSSLHSGWQTHTGNRDLNYIVLHTVNACMDPAGFAKGIFNF
jgi:hypothetical protein